MLLEQLRVWALGTIGDFRCGRFHQRLARNVCAALLVLVVFSSCLLWFSAINEDERLPVVSVTENRGRDATQNRRSRSSPALRAMRTRRFRIRRSADAPSPRRRDRPYYDAKTVPRLFRDWSSSAHRTCFGRLIGYGSEFALLKGVLVDRAFCRCARRGGEPINAVLEQAESAEYYTTERGCFRLPCSDDRLQSYYFYGENTHLNEWMNAVQPDVDADSADAHQIDAFTIAVQRYEYVNLFHTTTELYNAFLVMQFFGQTAARTNILVFDAHPVGSLDPLWPQLFNSTYRLSSLPARTRFRRLAWSVLGYNSPMKVSLADYPPLYDEFRHFFLSSYGVRTGRAVNCTRPSVLVLLRRDYVAHPRNPSGFVARKIRNEAALIERLARRLPRARVAGVQIDALSVRDQLRRIVDADVLLGVHGAGLTHALFLPRGAGLVEIAPNALWADHQHFEAIASWRRLVYQRWTNFDMSLDHEVQGEVTIPPQIAYQLVHKTLRHMCAGSQFEYEVTDVQPQQLETY